MPIRKTRRTAVTSPRNTKHCSDKTLLESNQLVSKTPLSGKQRRTGAAAGGAKFTRLHNNSSSAPHARPSLKSNFAREGTQEQYSLPRSIQNLTGAAASKIPSPLVCSLVSGKLAAHPLHSMISEEAVSTYAGHHTTEHFKKVAAEISAAGRAPQSVAFFYNPTEDLGVNERGVHRFIEHEENALRALGHDLTLTTINWDNLDSLRSVSADFAMHLCDGCGFDGEPGTEVMVALESSKVPFSGVGSAVHQLTNDKFAMKLALQRAGVPVPKGFVTSFENAEAPKGISYPMFVKPRFGFGSILIDSASCVRKPSDLGPAIARVVTGTGADALIEEYIDGREITVGVLGSGARTLVLPPLEIRFGSTYDGIPKIRMESTKSDPDSKYYWDFAVDCPAHLPPQVLRNVEAVALRAYQAVGGDGYGRIDMRLTPDGIPYVIEVNGNPCLDYGDNPFDSGIFPLIGLGTGWNYQDLIAHVVGAGKLRALRNYRQPNMTLRRYGTGSNLTETSLYASRALRAGAAICGVTHLGLSEDEAFSLLGVDPYSKALKVSDAPNTFVRSSERGATIVASRAVKAHEVLTISAESMRKMIALAPSAVMRSWA
jgi:D-alanine-D-alanine ligase